MAPSSPKRRAAKAERPLERHRSEKFDAALIKRSQINWAVYNPRSITEQARKRLKAAIEAVGLLGPVIWNKRTGNLVGGHQRLKCMDALAGGKEYLTQVSGVDLSPEDEVSANVLLNNPEAQGQWDFEKFGEILKKKDLDLVKAGLGAADVYQIIGEQASDEVLTEIAERIEKAREISEATANKKTDEHDDRYYAVIVFRSYAARKAWTDKLGLEDNRYVSGEDIADVVRG